MKDMKETMTVMARCQAKESFVSLMEIFIMVALLLVSVLVNEYIAMRMEILMFMIVTMLMVKMYIYTDKGVIHWVDGGSYGGDWLKNKKLSRGVLPQGY